MENKAKIEQLIQKYKKLLSEVPQKLDSIDAGFTVAFVMIIDDLESLQDTTEEKPTVATVLAYEQGYNTALSEVASILKKEKCVGIPYRNGIERGIEVAEELLANSV